MATYGKNMKWTVGVDHRDQMRKAMEVGLGVSRKPGDGKVDIYPFPNDSWVAIEFVNASDALTPDQLRRAPWLEFLVDDVDATVKRLSDTPAKRIDYTDKTHAYFQLPGGPVFRIAKSA